MSNTASKSDVQGIIELLETVANATPCVGNPDFSVDNHFSSKCAVVVEEGRKAYRCPECVKHRVSLRRYRRVSLQPSVGKDKTSASSSVKFSLLSKEELIERARNLSALVRKLESAHRKAGKKNLEQPLSEPITENPEQPRTDNSRTIFDHSYTTTSNLSSAYVEPVKRKWQIPDTDTMGSELKGSTKLDLERIVLNSLFDKSQKTSKLTDSNGSPTFIAEPTQVNVKQQGDCNSSVHVKLKRKNLESPSIGGADVIRDPKVAKPASNDDSQLAVMESIQNNTRPLNTVISQSAPTVLVEPEKCTDTSRFVLVGLVQCNTQQLDDDSSHSVFYEPSENQPML